LARLVTRLIDPSSGSVILDGVDITTLSGKSLREMRRKLQMIFQDPYSSLNPRHSIGQIIGDPMRIQGIVTKANEKTEVQDLMQRVGLNPEHYNRYPHEFSGGQRQRIGIARALSLRPSVIVADEPVSALDVSIQAQILNLLENLQKDLGLSFVFIAHDLSVVRHIADQVAVMYLGKIVELGDSATVYSNPSHPYTKALLSAVPVANPSKRHSDQRIRLVGDVPSPIDPPSGCRFRTRCWLATDLCAAQEPALTSDESGRAVACHFPLTTPVTMGHGAL
jgi:peptide/nickel transport system ATP-binding protein